MARLMLGALLLSPLWALAMEDREELSFRVWLGAQPIGEHHFTIARQGRQINVRSAASYDVKLWFANVFSYEHVAEELWEGNCLARMSSSTRENRRRSTLTAVRRPDTYLLQSDDQRRVEPVDCIGSYAYWDVTLLQRDLLVNAQTGSLDPVRLARLGSRSVPRLGRTALQYRLHSPQAAIDLWYSEAGEWLALETQANGRTLLYLNEDLGPFPQRS